MERIINFVRSLGESKKAEKTMMYIGIGLLIVFILEVFILGMNVGKAHGEEVISTILSIEEGKMKDD